MTEILAFFGAVNLILAGAVTLLLPIALAIWVNPNWLVLYVVYALFICIVGYAVIRYAEKHGKTGDA